MYNTNFNEILLDWASNSPNGLIDNISNDDNLNALYEVLRDNKFSNDVAISIVNEIGIISEKGKHPERQAYNKNGILVTFPTPDYKVRAISAGTHFEKNPVASQNNLFGGKQTAPSQPVPTGQQSTTPDMDDNQTKLPPSDTTQQQTEPATKDGKEPGASGTPATVSPTIVQSTETPAQGQLQTEPLVQPQSPVNVSPTPLIQQPTPTPSKTSAEIQTEKEMIKQMFNTDATLPTVPVVGGNGITEQLRTLTKIALDMHLNEAVRFLSKHI